MDNQIYLGFAIVKLSILMMYETSYDKLHPYFGREDLQLHYMACDSFVLSIKTQNIFKDLKIFGDLFGFKNLDEITS